jgi:hypothetical protein
VARAVSYFAGVSHSATPPWLEHVPLRCADLEYVPSLHFAVAPVGSVLLAVAVGADLVAVAVLAAVEEAAGAGVAAGAAAAAGVAGVAVAAAVAALAFVAFCTPP